MAVNSLREQILLNIVSTLEGISSIITVDRKMPFFDDQGHIEGITLPLAVVVGKVPKPDGEESDRVGSGYKYFTSELEINVSIYADADTNPDALLSNLMDDVWVGLLADTTRGGIALMTSIEPDDEEGLMHPYVIFHMNTTVRYQHGVDSI